MLRQMEADPVATWKVLLITYLALGAVIILLTRARKEVFGAVSPAEMEQNPTWKVVAFYCITIPFVLVFWPVFLPSWFRKKDSVLDLLQKPKSQGGSGLKEIYDAMNDLAEDGCDTDEIPGAEGEFGYDLSNPIPTHTTFGSTSYLGRLRTPTGEKVLYERIGSFGSPVSEMPVDGYELTDPGGKELGVIYLSPYQKRNSQKVPSGLDLEQ